VAVWVEDIGIVGYLSRPSDKDDFTYDAEVNLEHGHDHLAGGTHDHGFNNPSVNTYNPSHGHSIAIADVPCLTNFVGGISIGQGYTSYSSSLYKYPQFSWSCPYPSGNMTRHHIKLNFYQAGCTVRITCWGVTVYDNYSAGTHRTIDRTFSGYSSDSTPIQIYISKTNVVGTNFILNSIEYTRWYEPEIESNTQSTAVGLQNNANVNYKSSDTLGIAIKDIGDVQNLPESWQAVQTIAQANPTRTVTDKFELTQYLTDINWAWLQDREVSLIYQGSTDDVEVIVTYLYFQVEYLRRSIEKSTDITCFPTGSIEPRPDGTIQYLLNNIAGLPLTQMGCIELAVLDVWDDSETWVDYSAWEDEGEFVADPPVGAVFERAASWFEGSGYTIDGILSASLSVREAIATICKQTRSKLVWEGGKAKLAILQRFASGSVVDAIQPEDLQLRSLNVDLGDTQTIANSISLKYKYDYVNDYNYLAVISTEDADSIAKHGKKEFSNFFEFDLIRNDAMAADVADYYIWRYGLPETTYNFNLYLNSCALEKTDNIILTANNDWDRIRKLPLIIKDISRTFGSGKNNQINILNVSASSIRTKKHLEILTDTIILDESISVDLALDVSLEDLFTIYDENIISINNTITDNIVISDNLTSLFNSNKYLTDSVTITDELSAELSINNLEDFITINDSIITVEHIVGFGIMPFGIGSFGSADFDGFTLQSTFTITDEITVELT
jgi:hypothetical protein